MTPNSVSIQQILLITIQILTLGRFVIAQTDERNTNVVVIYTDEHSFRTIGAYRKLLSHDQAFIWGDGIKVHTPHIDALANEGVLFNNFYTVAPLCTPSRASLFSGLYPKKTGAWKNHSPMNGNIMTFADVMKEKRNMATGYFGKWHLDGEKKPLWKTNEGRDFGFNFNKYRWNRGHWKVSVMKRFSRTFKAENLVSLVRISLLRSNCKVHQRGERRYHDSLDICR